VARYAIKLSRQAERSLGKLARSQPAMARHVAHAIDHLAEEPHAGIPLRGDLKGCYKYRVGTYRIIYQIVHHVLQVIILDVGHRKEIYR
jgi:mRNA interferase RelE/StbE